MSEGMDVLQLWKSVNEALRRGEIINRALWEAADAAHPLTIDDDVLILGFEPKDMRHASYLETNVNKNRIQEILQARTGRRMDIKCIEGATLEHWERTKARDTEIEAKNRAILETNMAHMNTSKAWEDLNQRLLMLFQSTEARRLPSVQATLLIKTLPMVYETDTTQRAADPGADMIHNREVNRIFEKIATFCDLSSTQVALEYLRYRGSRKSG